MERNTNRAIDILIDRYILTDRWNEKEVETEICRDREAKIKALRHRVSDTWKEKDRL
jgi:hypothetical protein